MTDLAINKEAGTFTLEGTEHKLADISHIRIMNEDAKYKGKSRPFSHQVLGGVTMVIPIGNEPSFYVGLRLEMKDGTDLPVYVSEKPVRNNTDGHLADKKQAEALKARLEALA